MARQRIQIGVEAPDRGLQRFLDAWRRAQDGELTEPEVHLNFEDFSMLMALLTPGRLEILKALRQHGPLSVEALAKQVERDRSNVHVDTRALEEAGLLERTETDQLKAPWDIIDAHFSLVA